LAANPYANTEGRQGGAFSPALIGEYRRKGRERDNTPPDRAEKGEEMYPVFTEKNPIENIEKALKEFKGNVSTCARALGVNRGTIKNRINQFHHLKKGLRSGKNSINDRVRIIDGLKKNLSFNLSTLRKKIFPLSIIRIK